MDMLMEAAVALRALTLIIEVGMPETAVQICVHRPEKRGILTA